MGHNGTSSIKNEGSADYNTHRYVYMFVDQIQKQRTEIKKANKRNDCLTLQEQT